MSDVNEDLSLSDPPAPPPAPAPAPSSDSAPTPAASAPVAPPAPAAASAAGTAVRLEAEAKRDAAALKEMASGGGLMDFLNFRVFVFPVFVKYIYILFTLLVVLSGLATMFSGNGAAGVVGGLFTIVVGPVFVRLGCETSIVLFRIYEEIKK